MLPDSMPAGGGSPTLTNPDMILPYFENQHDGNHFPDSSYETQNLSSSQRISPLSNESSEMIKGGTVVPSRPRKKISPPRNLLAYEGYEHGAPLSDIGEEETTPRSRRTRSRSRSPIESSAIASHFAAAQKLFNDARLGHISRAETDAERWEDFGSRLQGNDEGGDEEDAGEGSLDGTETGETGQKDSLGSVGDDEMFSNALSRRAEEILANAKKRLTNMEGNLSRARTSLLVSPTNKTSFSMGEHQPAGGLYRSISQGGDRKLSGQSPLTKFRTTQSPFNTSPQSHTRGSSETGVPSSPMSSPTQYEARRGEFRSASAMETGRGRYTDLQYEANKPQTTDHIVRGTSGTALRSAFQKPLGPLKENDDRQPTVRNNPLEVRTHGLGISNAASYEDFQARHPPSGITRSTSQMQMRDISTKMNDLKSKISTLRVRAKEDHMRRRSLNSLRISSPFTAAEEWYASAPEYKEGASGLNTNAGYGWSPKQEQDNTFEDSYAQETALPGAGDNEEEQQGEQGTVIEHEDEVLEPDIEVHAEAQAGPAPEDYHSVVPESHYEDAFEGPSDESGESVATSEEEQIYLNEVLEESLHDQEDEHVIPDISSPEPERHEDRADAFDYEHFFLHSALGNYSQGGIHRRGASRDSMMSNDSIETARAVTPPVNDELGTTQDPSTLLAPPRRGHLRNDSLDSVSTMATFATATEGRGSDDGEESDSIPEEVLNWGGHAPMPGAINLTGWPPRNNINPTTVQINGYPTPVGEQHQRRPGTADSCSTSESSSTTREFPLTNNPGKLPTPPTLSPTFGQSSHRFSQGSDALLSSLVAASRSPSIGGPRSPVFAAETEAGVVLDDDDRDLLEGLFASLGNVCVHLSGEDGDSKYDRRVWRRRLDAARRILDGEIELE